MTVSDMKNVQGKKHNKSKNAKGNTNSKESSKSDKTLSKKNKAKDMKNVPASSDIAVQNVNGRKLEKSVNKTKKRKPEDVSEPSPERSVKKCKKKKNKKSAADQGVGADIQNTEQKGKKKRKSDAIVDDSDKVSGVAESGDDGECSPKKKRKRSKQAGTEIGGDGDSAASSAKAASVQLNLSKIKEKKKEKMKAKKAARKKRLSEQKEQLKMTQAVTSGTVTTCAAMEEALAYLRMFVEDKNSWKFNKHRQICLLKNMYDSEKIPDTDFSLMIKYISGLQGKSRELTQKQAEAFVKVTEAVETTEEKEEAIKEMKLERARQIIQILT